MCLFLSLFFCIRSPIRAISSFFFPWSLLIWIYNIELIKVEYTQCKVNRNSIAKIKEKKKIECFDQTNEFNIHYSHTHTINLEQWASNLFKHWNNRKMIFTKCVRWINSYLRNVRLNGVFKCAQLETFERQSKWSVPIK